MTIEVGFAGQTHQGLTDDTPTCGLHIAGVQSDNGQPHPAPRAVVRGRDRNRVPQAFQPGRIQNGVPQSFAGLDRWLARFSADALFTVTVQSPRPCRGGKQAVYRDEHHRQLSAQGVRRLAARHGARVRRIEPERIGAAAWSAAIERFGTCE